MGHARQTGYPAVELGEEVGLRSLVGITQGGEGEFSREHVARIKSRIDVLQPNETFEKQTGAGEEHERECYLCDDERATQPVMVTPGRGTTAAFLERFSQVGLATGEAGSETKEQS